jgi:hypothetical protein
VEELPSQLCWQGIPLHDQSCTKASKDMFLFRCKGRAARSMPFQCVRCFVVIILMPLFVVGECGEALVELLKFTPFI